MSTSSYIKVPGALSAASNFATHQVTLKQTGHDLAGYYGLYQIGPKQVRLAHDLPVKPQQVTEEWFKSLLKNEMNIQTLVYALLNN